MQKNTRANSKTNTPRRKTKMWKKILVGFMSFNMIIGNFSSMTITAYAAEEEIIADAEAQDNAEEAFSEEIPYDGGDASSENSTEYYENLEEQVIDEAYDMEAVVEETPEEMLEQEYVPVEEVAIDEEIIYTVNFFDVEGNLIDTSEYHQGQVLKFPSGMEDYVWKNAAGTTYNSDIVLTADVDLYASKPVAPETKKNISVKAVCVDTDGNSISDSEIKINELTTVTSFMKDTANIVIPKIADYEYVEAKYDGNVISKVKPDETEICIWTADDSTWNTFEDGGVVYLLYKSLSEDTEELLEEEDAEPTFEATVVQKASRQVFSKTVNMSYVISVTNTSEVDASQVEVRSEIPSIITINSGSVIDNIDIPAGQTVKVSLSGVINENTDDVDCLNGRFYVDSKKVDSVSFEGAGRLLASQNEENGEGPTYLSTNIDGMTVSVSAADGSILPAGTVLNVSKVSLSGVDAIEQTQDISIAEAYAYDVTLTINGEEVQPDGSVVVSFYDLPFDVEDGENVGVAHMGNGDTVEGISSGSGEAVSIEATHFSVYIIFKTAKYVPSGNQTLEDGTALAAFDFGVFANSLSSSGHQNISFVTANLNGEIESGLNNGDKISSDQKAVYIQHLTESMDISKALINYNDNREMKYVFGPTISIVREGNNIYAEETVDGKLIRVGLYTYGDQYNALKVLGRIYTTEEDYIDIAKELDNAANYSGEIYDSNSTKIKVNADNQGNNGRFTLDTTNEGEGRQTYQMTAEELRSCTSGITINTNQNQTVVINVVCSADTYNIMTNVNFNNSNSNEEASAIKNLNVIWNFVDTEGNPYTGKIIFDRTFKGTILAPRATIESRQNDGTIIANSVLLTGENHVSTQTTVSYAAYKVWSDNKNDAVTVILYQQLRYPDGSFMDGGNINRDAARSGDSRYKEIKSMTLTSGNNFSGVFRNLDAVDENGNECSYFIVEDKVPDGYTAIYQGHTVYNSTSQAIPVSVSFAGSKTVNQAVPGAGEVFTFEVYGYEGGSFGSSPIFTAQNSGGSISFPSITLDGTGYSVMKNDKPCYYYKIVEKQENKAGYTYDQTQYIAEVILTNVNGRWIPEVNYYRFGGDEAVNLSSEYNRRSSSVAFNNVRNQIIPEPVDYTFSVTKLMDGDWPDGAEFTFKLEALPDSGNNYTSGTGPMPANDTVTVSKNSPTASFGTITFEPDGSNGYSHNENGETIYTQCYMYKMYEVAGNIPGVTYSDKVQYIKIWQNNAVSGNAVIRTWLEVNGSTDNVNCAGTLGEITFTNSYEEEKVEVSVSKSWIDDSNKDGLRPESVTIHLLADGKATDKSVVLSETNGWKYTFTDLEKYNSSNSEIVYSITEDKVADYTTEITGGSDGSGYSYTVTNTHEVKTTEVSGVKTWDDNDNQDGVRPESITVNLLANGEKVDSKTVSASDNWSYKFTDLPEYKNGSKITYTISEASVTGYTTAINGFNITNSYKPATTSVTVTKKWVDNRNQDGVRPGEITVTLYADGNEVKTVTLSGNTDTWSYTFTGLNKYADGNEIKYTAKESYVASYDASYSADGLTITNTHTTELTSVSGTKTWDDADNQDGKRPESITVNLLADGVKTASKTVTAKNNWSYSFDNLPKYADGNEIKYTITEGEVADYSSSISGYDITNSYTPGKTSVSGSKTWNDSNNQDGKRPTSITIRLLADGSEVKSQTISAADDWSWEFKDLPEYRAGKKIVYTISEDEVTGYKTSINGFNVVNTHEPEDITVSGVKSWDDSNNQDGIRPTSITVNLYANGTKKASQVVTAGTDGSWSYSFNNLPKYADGKEIIYTVDEDKVDGYTTTINGLNITNSHVTEKTEVSGVKTWDDSNNQDGVRPESVIIKLYADGKYLSEQVVTGGASNEWTYSFTDLPKYSNGNEIVYTISEVDVEGYSVAYSGFDITNSYTPAKVSVSGVKTWDDANNQDGVRPDSIVVNLYADKVLTDTKTVTAADNWSWTFADLPEYKAGNKIEYTIGEEEVKGYTTEINGFNITNSYIPETTKITVTKNWSDNSNQDGVRPSNVEVTLYADGEIVKTATITGTADTWTYTFEDLPKYKNGNQIVYTAVETPVDYYETTYSEDQLTITNTHTTELTSVSGTKTWDDANNQDGKRPESITINLWANGEKLESKSVSSNDNWTYTFDNLPKYENGVEIQYTVTEDEVTDYSTSISGYDITNSYTPGETSVSGVKTWDDNDNQDGKRPESITINLLADGTVIDSKTVTEADGWSWEFTQLPLMSAGNPIEYTISEDSVEGYESKINEYNVTNSYTPETISVSGTKTWDDNDNQDGIRPTSINVSLFAGDTKITEKTVTEEDNWSYSFDNLPKYADGELITYSVKEDAVTGYEASVDGMNITNNHKPETISVSGVKTWVDSDNQDGRRPDQITIRLWANGTEVESLDVVPDAAGNWSWEFTELPKFAAGEEITYTITEDEVDAYESEVNGFNVTNTHIPATTSVKGVKVWDDGEDQDGIRPSSITIQLLADGQPLGNPFTVTATDNWTWNKTDLPMYKDNGNLIIYSYEEVVSGTGVAEGYEAPVYSGPVAENGINVYTITNTHKPEETAVTINKSWIGESSADSVEVTIIGRTANGNEVVSKTASVSAASGWTLTMDKLPKKHNGEDILYYVSETVPADNRYVQVDADGNPLTGDDTLIPVAGGTAALYNLGTTDVTVEKQWISGNDNLTSAWASIIDSVELTLCYADGTEVTTDANGAPINNPVSVGSRDGWTYKWTNLPVNKQYTVKENINSQLAEYFNKNNGGNPTILGDTPNYLIIQNEIDPLELTVNKEWRGDEPGTVHDDIQVRVLSSVDLKRTTSSVFMNIRKLLGGDASNWYEYDTITLGAGNNWSATVNDLPRFVLVGDHVEEVSYAVEEVNAPKGYNSVTNVNGSTATIINTAQSAVGGFKVWDDNSDSLGLRPDSTSFASNIVLYQDGNEFMTGADTEHFAWISTEGNTWSFTFEGLESGHTYTVGELNKVPGYSEPVVEGTTITNRIEFTDVTVTKLWDDFDNAYGSRPTNVSFRLLANGVEAQLADDTAVISLGNNSGASYTWTSLPKYDKNGISIIYSVEEVDIPEGYAASMTNNGDVYTVTNRFRPETTNVSVYKVWDDQNNADRIRPSSIEVSLFRNGESIETVTLNSGNGWSYSWRDLPTKLMDGHGTAAEYSVREISQILGYSVRTENNGNVYTITNYHRGGDNPPGDNPPGDNPPGDNPPGDNPPGDNPPDEPTPDDNRPVNDTPYTIPDEPVPLAGASDVLGVRRAPAGSVLGARRSPKTGDTSNAGAFVAAMASAGAMMGAWFSMRKKKKG